MQLAERRSQWSFSVMKVYMRESRIELRIDHDVFTHHALHIYWMSLRNREAY